jgi:serine/threonine-protein kinase
VVTDAPDARGGCWATDDTFYFAPTNISGIWRVAAAGGPATEFVRKDQTLGEITLRWPHVLPDGKGLLFTAWTGPGPDENQIVFRSLAADGARSVLARGGNMPVYAPTGHLLYGRLDQLFALPWTPGHAGPGDAVPVALPEMPRLEGEGAADYAVANDGTLAYLAGGPTHRAHRLVFVDRAGKVEALPVPEREYESVVVSPDGRQAAVQVLDGTTGLWLYDFAHQTLSPLLTRGGSNQAPVWTPDSKRIVYRGTRNGSRNLYAMAADGTGVEERLTNQPDVVQTPQCVTPDGHWLLFSNSGQGATGGSTHVWRVELAGSHKTEPVIEGASRTNNGRVSPDGNWLAVESWASGRAEICVMHLPGPGPLQQVSTDGGTEPLWSHDGRELFFVNIDRLLAVDVGQGPDFAPGTPHVLHEGRFRANINSNTAYDLAPDGRRFLRIQQVRPVRTVNTIDVVLNWFTELRRVAAPK